MADVAKLIDLIVQGKNTEASEVLNQELMGRAYEGLGGLKPQVAADYFAAVVDMPSDGQEIEYSNPEPEEEPTDETD